MNWNNHSGLVGKHAILNPSGYQWIRYSADESREALFNRYRSEYAQTIGTLLHEFACKRIKYRMRLKKHDKDSVLFYLVDHGIPVNAFDSDYIFENLHLYLLKYYFSEFQVHFAILARIHFLMKFSKVLIGILIVLNIGKEFLLMKSLLLLDIKIYLNLNYFLNFYFCFRNLEHTYQNHF